MEICLRGIINSPPSLTLPTLTACVQALFISSLDSFVSPSTWSPCLRLSLAESSFWTIAVIVIRNHDSDRGTSLHITSSWGLLDQVQILYMSYQTFHNPTSTSISLFRLFLSTQAPMLQHIPLVLVRPSLTLSQIFQESASAAFHVWGLNRLRPAKLATAVLP